MRSVWLFGTVGIYRENRLGCSVGLEVFNQSWSSFHWRVRQMDVLPRVGKLSRQPRKRLCVFCENLFTPFFANWSAFDFLSSAPDRGVWWCKSVQFFEPHRYIILFWKRVAGAYSCSNLDLLVYCVLFETLIWSLHGGFSTGSERYLVLADSTMGPMVIERGNTIALNFMVLSKYKETM